MKKILLIAALVLAISGSAGAYFLTREDNKKPPASTSSTSSPQTSPTNTPPATPEVPQAEKTVCGILTQDVADIYMEGGAIASDSNKEAPRDSNNVIISTCTYNSADGTKTASLLMRVAKNAEGSAHDKEQFGPNKPSTAQTLSGYGDSAYWDADFKQLNILKGTTWYIITAGPNQVSSRTVDQARLLADLLVQKF